jgi:hypothetical protein
MSLWGNKDLKSSSGTVALATSGVVTGTSTAFTTELKVGNAIKIGGTWFTVVTITSDTSLKVKSAIPGDSISSQGAGQTIVFSEKPSFVSTSESVNSSGTQGDPTKVYGVDTTETAVQESKIAHAGWVRRIAGSGGRTGRVQTEVLVASSSISGDQSDDSQFPDA